MANTIFSNNKPVHHPSRTAHDLSSTHAFSMRPAVLRPVIYQDTVPNSAFRINCTDLVRTSALQTAAFLRAKHELDFFFVPFNLINPCFNDVVFQRSDVNNPILSDNVGQGSLPLVNLSNVYRLALLPYLFDLCVRYDEPVFEKTGGHISIYLFQQALRTVDSFSWNNDFTVLQNACCYRSCVISDMLNMGELVDSDFIGADVFALLDTCGYPNIVPYIDSYFIEWYDNLTDSSDVNEELPILFDNLFNGFLSTSAFEECDVNPMRLFAYQKIFIDRYRDSVIDNNPSYPYAAYVYSDDLSDSNFNLSSIICPLYTWLRPRLRTYKKDLFTGVYPSAQFGNPSSLNEFAAHPEYYNKDGLNLPSDSTSAPNMNSAIAIRATLAMQKYRETLLRAGNRTKDLMKSEFGVESKYINETYVQYLGSFSGNLDLNKVSATAETGSYSVGDLAANVFSSLSGDTIEFTCNDYGVIVGVMSFIPEVLNNSFGISPFNIKSNPLHYFHDAFDDLGLQPVSSDTASFMSQQIVDNRPIISHTPSVLGYSARYNEYKQNLDIAHDSFCTNAFRFHDGISTYSPRSGFNSNYVLVRPIQQTLSGLRDRNYVMPSVFDTIFVSRDTGLFEGYHFDVILDCSINAVLPMSNLGLPNM